MLTCLFAALIVVEPDLGTTIALMLMMLGILVVAGVPGRVLAGATTLALTAGLAAIWIEPYRRARVFSFLDPWSDPQNAGFQTVQAMIGLGSGGLTGKGLGEGVQKINYLPEQQTDMILAVIGEELGLIGTTAVIAAFGAFAFAGFSVALRCRDPFGKLLAAGITSLVCGQAAVNLAAVLGVAPLTGIPLPFVSYGGSSLWSCSPPSGSSLTSRSMSAHPNGELRCLIAAGGTAGHVLPSLAVAEALRARGVHVTFAGSPDRVEARLVPEAGYELDTFEIAGLSAPAVARASALARSRRGRAPRACAAILQAPAAARRARRRRLRRRADGLRRVAAELPAALTEAEAHLGLANRLAAPFAKRVFLAYGIQGRDGSKYRVTGPAGARARISASRRRRAGAASDLRRRARAGLLRRARRSPESQRVRGRDLRRLGADRASRLGRAGLREPARPGAQGRLRAPRVDERVRCSARCSRHSTECVALPLPPPAPDVLLVRSGAPE